MIEILFIIFMIVFFISSNNIEKSLKRTEEQNKQIIQLLKEKQEKEWGVGALLFFVFLIDEEGKVEALQIKLTRKRKLSYYVFETKIDQGDLLANSKVIDYMLFFYDWSKFSIKRYIKWRVTMG